MPDLAIRCRGLVKRYPPDVLAVDGLDLTIERGECFGLLGPNGAGKTTTVEILEGLTAPTAGEVEVLGQTWAKDPAALRARLGITLQETHLYERLTVEELLRLFRSFYPSGRGVDEVIALVALEEKRRARYERLSGGQKQRLAVACALVGEPELLFLDEPTTGLDPQSRRQLWDVVLGMKASGRTVLLTTHYMDEADKLCNRIAIVDHGELVALDAPMTLKASIPGKNVLEVSFGSAPADWDQRLRTLPGVENVVTHDHVARIASTNGPATTLALMEAAERAGVTVQSLSVQSTSLDDVFVHYTGRALRDALQEAAPHESPFMMPRG